MYVYFKSCQETFLSCARIQDQEDRHFVFCEKGRTLVIEKKMKSVPAFPFVGGVSAQAPRCSGMDIGPVYYVFSSFFPFLRTYVHSATEPQRE